MITVKLKDKFDLGYITLLEDGREGQLRVIEMKGECLQHHLDSSEHELFGKRIQAYIIHESKSGALLSQFNAEERNQREEESKLRKKASESCKLGQEYDVKIIGKRDWGYIFKQVLGYLEGAISSDKLTESTSLKIGVIVTVKVIGFSKIECPVFSIK